jgi:hypothetical protein
MENIIGLKTDIQLVLQKRFLNTKIQHLIGFQSYSTLIPSTVMIIIKRKQIGFAQLEILVNREIKLTMVAGYIFTLVLTMKKRLQKPYRQCRFPPREILLQN